MKKTHLILVLGLIVLNSCIVKSLHPFYTQDLIYFEQKIIGDWLSPEPEKANWSFKPFKEVMLEESKKNFSELNKDELKMYNNYKDGYVVTIGDSTKSTTFLAMPFMINNQLFLDFIPIEDSEMDQSENNFYKMHLINTHTLAKLDMSSNDSFSIKWLSEDKLRVLFEENRIKIKYEKIGFDETVILTASSEELVKFIEKYMSSKDEDKWKTDVEVNLKRS